MAHPAWLKKYLRMKPEVSDIFSDLAEFKAFCVKYGRVFNEADLYNNRSETYQDFNRNKAGKNVKNGWSEELKKMA